MMRASDIHWLAGLMEGEGCFTIQRTGKGYIPLLVVLAMTDIDVVERAAQMIGVRVRMYQRTSKGKPIYRIQLHGPRAVQWMMTLYGLMGQRRRLRIRELLALWRLRVRPGNRKLTDAQVTDIRRNAQKLSYRKLARHYGVSRRLVGNIIRLEHRPMANA